MNCPDCGHKSGPGLLKCSSCGEIYERESLETLLHLEYLLSWISKQEKAIETRSFTHLREEVQGEVNKLRDEILPSRAVIQEPVRLAKVFDLPAGQPEIARELAATQAVLDIVPTWTEAGVSQASVNNLRDHLIAYADALREALDPDTLPVEQPSRLDVIEFALQNIESWSNAVDLHWQYLGTIEILLKREREAILTPSPVEDALPPVIPEPVPAPKPTAPPIDWAALWERTWGFVVSGALLRGLLYLGAFMIVVSATVLVVRFWDIFPQAVQLIFIASVPTAFYGAGWAVRAKLKLPQAGTVLAGIGALLVAVDFAAVYQFGGLSDQIALIPYWLVASIVCTLIYAISSWRLPTEFFGYVTLIGGSSALLALTEMLLMPLEWQVAVMTASASGMVVGAARLSRVGDRYSFLARASRRFAQILLFASLAIVLFIPGPAAFGQFGILVFASLGYGLLNGYFPHRIVAHASVWSTIGAYAFLLRSVHLSVEWYGMAVGVLTILYMLGEQWMKQRINENTAVRKNFYTAIKVATWALTVLCILLGFLALAIQIWAGVITLTLAALTLGWRAQLHKKPVLVLAAGGLFIAPFSFALHQWLFVYQVPQSGAWLMAGWAGLSLVYLGLAVLMRKAEAYGAWLNLLAHALAPAASIGLMINYFATAGSWSNVPTLVALGAVISVYVASAVIHDSGRHPALSNYVTVLLQEPAPSFFIWPVGFLLPIWISIAWAGSILQMPWLGVALAQLGLVYVVVGEMLSRRKAVYRLPLHVYAYLLSIVGILVAFGDQWALLTSLYLVVTVLTTLALVYRRIWETALAALLFLWPFQLTLELSPLTTHAYSLAYALLASLGYIPLGLRLDRIARKFALPEYVLGYAVSAFAVATSLLGRFDVYELDVPWIGVVTPLIVSGLLVYSSHKFKSVPFAWAAVVAFPIFFGQALTLFRVAPEYDATCWVVLACVYMLVERALAARATVGERLWHSLFRMPLVVGMSVLYGLALILTVVGTLTLFSGLQVTDHVALILAQSLAVGLAVLAAWMYRSRIPLYVASFLSFFPFTSAWIVYAPMLKIAQFAWVWMGLATVLLIAGFSLDKQKVRYAHAPYLAGYLLAGFSLAWSAQDRFVNIYTLAAVFVLMVLSHIVVHKGLHKSFDDCIRLVWRKTDTIARRVAQLAFLWSAACALPVWLIQLLTYAEVSLAWRGLALALIAPLYIALGLLLKRVKADYTWPLYGIGYLLTMIGAMLAFDDQLLGIVVLALNAVVYASSAYIFRQPFWLYLSNVLIPVIALLSLHYNQKLTAPWVSGIFMGLAYLYLFVGLLFERNKDEAKEGISPFALTFFAPGLLLSAIAIGTASGEKTLALTIYSCGVVFYALSAWAFRESIFLYPAAWLAAVPYYLVMTLTPLQGEWYGIGWLPLILGYLMLGRFVFHKTSLGITNLSTFVKSLFHPAMPFYLLAYALSVSMMVLSYQDPLALAIAFTAGAGVYFLSASIFRHFVWLYPGLLVTHFATAAFFALRPSGVPYIYITLPFLALTWLVAMMGQWFARRFPITRQPDDGSWPFVGYLLTPSWAQPFLLFTCLNVILWQVLAQNSFDTAIILAIGNALLLGTFAVMWLDTALAYGSLALLLLAISNRLGWIGVPFADALAWVGGIGFGFYILAWIGEWIMTQGQRAARVLSVWLKPLEVMSILLTATAVLGTLPQVTTYTLAGISSLAFAGVLYLTIAYRGRHIRLSYLGLALLELAWVFVLLDRSVTQPQWYAIPAGLYFVFVGHLERRQGRKSFAALVEGFGLTVLLLTSFIQSLNGAAGFPYFLLLLVEGLVVVWWGASQRRKIPFFLGIGASALNVVAQVIVLVNVYDVHRWIIILGVGILLVTTAVFVERKRLKIIARAQEWLEVLDTWE